MRSYILPLAALVASVVAVPVPAKDCVTQVYEDKVVEIYDVTITSTVYVTAGSEPTATYVPPPPPTSTYVAPVETYVPVPSPEPEPVYTAPTYEEVTYNAPEPEPQPSPKPEPVPEVSAPTGNDEADCLAAHNKYRALHNAPPLKWSTELANFARAANGGSCAMVHTGGPYGENLAKGYSDVNAAIKGWYDEHTQYTGGYSPGVGHFTQLVWKATTELGCYKRSCGDGDLLICEYRVPGNVVGNNNQYFAENVSA